MDIRRGNVSANIDLSRITGNFQKAQYYLDSTIMASMVPYMPMQTGSLINLTRAESASLAGTGRVCAAYGPYGRYLYEGKKMVDSETGKGPRRMDIDGEIIYRYRKGAKLIATDEPLNYDRNAHPGVTDHWFDTAKANHLNEWIEGVKRVCGGK